MFLSSWLSLGMVFILVAVAIVLLRCGSWQLRGQSPVSKSIFIAILFTSGLDVGLIMFPLTEFPVYENTVSNPEYAFSNPLAIEFGFWGVMVWAIYFLTCFYFCALEPRLGFFKRPIVRIVNNIIIIGTCAFTAYLLFSNLSWYLPIQNNTFVSVSVYTAIVVSVIVAAVWSSTDIRFVKILSLASGGLFLCLVLGLLGYLLIFTSVSIQDYVSTGALLLDYFPNLHKFILPINDYHMFYLYWWFSWSIMIGQFTARFVGNTNVRILCFNMLFWPSLSIALWFSVLYTFHLHHTDIPGIVNLIMVAVGIVFVVNSLDSLIRLYSENLKIRVEDIGVKKYQIFHTATLLSLTAFFSFDVLKIEWVGALVIALLFACLFHAALFRFRAKRSS